MKRNVGPPKGLCSFFTLHIVWVAIEWSSLNSLHKELPSKASFYHRGNAPTRIVGNEDNFRFWMGATVFIFAQLSSLLQCWNQPLFERTRVKCRRSTLFNMNVLVFYFNLRFRLVNHIIWFECRNAKSMLFRKIFVMLRGIGGWWNIRIVFAFIAYLNVTNIQTCWIPNHLEILLWGIFQIITLSLHLKL